MVIGSLKAWIGKKTNNGNCPGDKFHVLFKCNGKTKPG